MKTVMAMAAFVGILASGCSRETTVRGQVFIVRGDRETVRLSGARVMTGEEPEIKSRLAMIQSEIDEFRKTAKQRIAEAESKLRELGPKLTQARVDYKNAEHGLQSVDDYVTDQKKRIEEAGASSYMSSIQKQAYDKAIEKRKSEIEKSQSANRQGWEVELSRRRRDLAEMESAESRLKQTIADSEAELKPSGLAKKFFSEDFQKQGFPSALTDADGKFSLTVRPKEQPMIVVRAERKTPGGTEFYLWAEPVNGTNIILANENMYWSANQPDQEKL